MTDNVHYLDIITRLDIPAVRVLEGALEKNMQSVVVMGYDANGEFYASSSLADGADILWLIELLKKELMP